MCNLIFWMSVVLLDSNLILCRGDWRLFLREYVLFDGMDVFFEDSACANARFVYGESL